MPYLAIVTVIALLEFFYFGIMVGRARTRYNVPAPFTTGNEEFERYFRVHMNTLEQLIVFLPLAWVFGYYVSEIWAAALGAVFVIGRALYYVGYIKDPKKRSLGFALTALPNFALMIGVLTWAVRAAVKLAAV
jgi:glutathione S-transferase